MRTLDEVRQQKREQWVAFKKEKNKKIYTRAVITIERDEKIVGQSNFHSWIVNTERGEVRLTINKGTPVPTPGSIIEFKILPYKNSYDRFYISEIVREIPRAAEHYLFELWEIDELNKMKAVWITE